MKKVGFLPHLIFIGFSLLGVNIPAHSRETTGGGKPEPHLPTIYLVEQAELHEHEWSGVTAHGYRLYKYDLSINPHIEKPAELLAEIITSTGAKEAGLLWGKGKLVPTLVVYDRKREQILWKTGDSMHEISVPGLGGGEVGLKRDALVYWTLEGKLGKFTPDGKTIELPVALTVAEALRKQYIIKVSSKEGTNRVGVLAFDRQIRFSDSEELAPRGDEEKSTTRDILLSPSLEGVIFHSRSQPGEVNPNLIRIQSVASSVTRIFTQKTPYHLMEERKLTAEQRFMMTHFLAMAGATDGTWPVFAQSDSEPSALGVYENNNLVMYFKSDQGEILRREVLPGIYSRGLVNKALPHFRDWDHFDHLGYYIDPNWFSSCARILGAK